VKDDRLYLNHMFERCQRVSRFTTGGREQFLVDERTQEFGSGCAAL
jgi:uncharacterized protein with HEPN domain